MLQFAKDHWDKLIVAVVAIYGAVVSTITLAQNRRRDRRVIEVTLSFGMFTYGAELGPPMAFVKAGNVGDKRVRIEGIGLKLPRDRTVVFMNRHDFDRLPCDLDGGMSCSSGTEMAALRAQLKGQGYLGTIKLRPYAFDTLGTYFYGKRKKLDLNG